MFPHHEDEIAQTEGAVGKKFVNYWLHCEHLLVDNKKMSKLIHDMDIEVNKLGYLVFKILKSAFKNSNLARELNLKNFIRDVPDFPKPGIMFKDITPLIENPQAVFFNNVLNSISIFMLCGISAYGILAFMPRLIRSNEPVFTIRGFLKLA